jgi:D-3-phosphoglycerate dehydrogenase
MGIPVFNAPGANANAVKELVLAGMLIGCRNLINAWEYVQGLDAADVELNKLVEAGKKQFAGFELPGKTLGVIGLGAIGRNVANMALELGMKVIGFDPGLTVEGAWQLSANVEKAVSVEQVFSHSDFITFHVPLIDATRKLLNAERLKLMKKNAVVLNFARDGIVDNDAILAGVKSGKIYAYVCDFPSNQFKGQARIFCFPHLGASTTEAEDNCAIMIANQLRDYLENGNIKNSVNFPDVQMERTDGFRLCIVNSNVPNMLGQISTTLANENLNIVDMLNKSRGELAYTMVDVDQAVNDKVIAQIKAIDGVLAVRAI